MALRLISYEARGIDLDHRLIQCQSLLAKLIEVVTLNCCMLVSFVMIGGGLPEFQ